MRTTSVVSAYHNPSCYELVHKSSLLVFFSGSYSTKTGVDARKNVSRINLRLFNSRCDKFMTKLLLA